MAINQRPTLDEGEEKDGEKLPSRPRFSFQTYK